MSEASLTTTDANAPYDSTAYADLIIRSSDNVHFYVVGPLLCLVSPVFRQVFSRVSGDQVAKDDENKRGHPIILLTEDSGTLYLLLDLLYPRSTDPLLTSVNQLWKVGKATKKYFMDAVEGKLKSRVFTSQLINSQPLGIYAVATDLEWNKVAAAAARLTLKIPLEKLDFAEELHGISGTGFYRFLEYRLRCEKSSTPQLEFLNNWPKTLGKVSSRLRQATTKRPDKVLGADTSLTDPGKSGGRLRQSTPSQPNKVSSANTSLIVLSDPPVNVEPQAPAPFNESTKADLIIRSSDSVDFFVIEVLIRLVSPVFDSMFPLESHETKAGRAVITVGEHSKVLHWLLDIVYHHSSGPDILDSATYKKIVLSLRKYKMTSIEKRLHNQAKVSPFVLKDPLRMYIVATAVGWDDVAKVAALNTFSQPLNNMAYTKEMNIITGADLYRLVQFRFRCGDVAWKSLEGDNDFKTHGPSNWSKFWDRESYYSGDIYKPISLDELSAKIKASPRASTITEIFTSQSEKLGIYTNLKYIGRPSTVGSILKCWSSIGNVIEAAVSNVFL